MEGIQMNYNIATIPGDGIGPEVVGETIKVLEKIGQKFNHTFNFTEVLAGGCAFDATGSPLPQETIDICKKSDSVLLGAVGGPKWDGLSGSQRPEAALLGLRGQLGLFTNLRPALLHEALKDACPLKPEYVKGGLDIMVVRELTGGIYFGERGYREGKYGQEAYDTEAYSEFEIKRIAKIAFEAAMQRNKKVTSVDKANILESSRLWRKVVNEMAKQYPEVTVDHLYVDNAAMQLVRDPKQFDVIVTSNMFGDILSDEASMITGSIGMLPSASLNETSLGMYEPIHGSAPDIAGKGIANPIATILSAAMMLRYSFKLEKEAKTIEDAVTKVLNAGYRTGDIMSEGMKKVGTIEMGKLVLENI
jgi:3-isopropylmalate dehydrogenase